MTQKQEELAALQRGTYRVLEHWVCPYLQWGLEEGQKAVSGDAFSNLQPLTQTQTKSTEIFIISF